MGLIEQAYETYCAMEKQYVGVYGEKGEPLVPISHQIVKADIEITLDEAGNFLNAREAATEDAKIIVPVTEKSAGRTGDTICAHPLCDQIRFLTPQYPQKYAAYLTQLHQWENSAYSHPKLHVIARYVERGTVLQDIADAGLIKINADGFPASKPQEKLVVCWRVESGETDDVSACWKDRSLLQAFIDYYASTKQEEPVFCMVSGTNAIPATQHPKKIVTANSCANAKLVSANDTSGFTYRGRFTTDAQAMTMGYEASQKIHNAIHWLAANQGVPIGNRTFLCWNPKGIELPKPRAAFLRGNGGTQVKYSDYRKALSETLRGWKNTIPSDEKAIVTAFAAATSGRLAVTYYSELMAQDFVERLCNWDDICCWHNGPYGIQSPSLSQIVDCAFGTVRKSGEKTILETDDRVKGQQLQRMLSCRVDKQKIPLDIRPAVAGKASNLQIMDAALREKVLSTACAVIRKYYYDWYQEEWNMALEPEKKDISYQYGRLLAVFEKIERDTYDKNEGREPNAIRMQSVLAKRPQYASCIVWEQLKKAYYPKLKPNARGYYDRLVGQIIAQISDFPDGVQNKALGDTYLMGYYLQRNALYTSNTSGTGSADHTENTSDTENTDNCQEEE